MKNLKEENSHNDNNPIVCFNLVGDCVETVYNQLRNNHKKLELIVDSKTKPSDFEILKNIAKGGYGEVFLAKKDKIYAMKRVPKDIILKQPHTALFMAEKEVLIDSIGSEWLVSADLTLQDDQFLYYLMDFIPGGDFMGLLSKEDVLEEDWVRFYVVEIVAALDELHSLGWIHRDLKPDNILIGLDGHIKLADFGSCIKMVDGKARSSITVGTPDYVSPDILISKSELNEYGENLDFWTLGVIIYEMVYGTTPFYSSTLVETYKKINEVNYIFPFKIGEDLKDLIEKLICKKEERLGINEIKNHIFFKGIDWNNVKGMIPPFIPEIEGEYDTSNFVDTNFEMEKNKKREGSNGREGRGEYLPFVGFSHDPKICEYFKKVIKENDDGGNDKDDKVVRDGDINKVGDNIKGKDDTKVITDESLSHNNLLLEIKSLENTKDNLKKEIKNKQEEYKSLMMCVVDEKEELEQIQEEIREKTEILKKILNEINDRKVILGEDVKESKEGQNGHKQGETAEGKGRSDSKDFREDPTVTSQTPLDSQTTPAPKSPNDPPTTFHLPKKDPISIKFQDENYSKIISEKLSDHLALIYVNYEDCEENLKNLKIDFDLFYDLNLKLIDSNLLLKNKITNLEIENGKMKKIGVDSLKKQVRIMTTEIKEYEQKLNQEIHLRKKLEEELKSLQKSKNRQGDQIIKSIEFNCKLLNNQNNNHNINGLIKIIDDQFFLNEISQNLGNVFIHELKNNELHHLSYKNRSLSLKIIFIKETIKSVSSVGRRNLKSLEEDLKIEESMVKGLETMISLLNGKQLEEASKQLEGSRKKMAQLKSEISMARKSSILQTEEIPEDPVKLYEFNNHLFSSKTFEQGTLCEHCNEVLYGIKDQGFECRDCKMVVHKSCYVLGDVSCEMYSAFKTGETYFVMMRTIEEKEKLMGVYKKY